MRANKRLSGKHTESCRRLLRTGIVGLFCWGWSLTAAASLVHDIFACDQVTGGTCDQLIGQIEFPQDSGSQSDGQGISLSYVAVGTSFDEGDIQNIEWLIDPENWLLSAFEMNLDSDPGCFLGTSVLPCSQVSVNFNLFDPGLASTDGSAGGCGETTDGPICSSGTFIGVANRFVPVHAEVPLPATLTLVGLGLLGLARVSAAKSGRRKNT